MVLEIIFFSSGHLQFLTEVISFHISHYNLRREIRASEFNQVNKFF